MTIDNQLHEHDAQPLLSVSTNSAQYLRFTALDDFNGNSFGLVKSDAAPGRVDGRLSSPTPGVTDLVSQTPVQATISVLPALQEKYLPLPYSPVDVKISGNWQLSPSLRTVFSTSDTTAGKVFTVNSLVPTPSRDQLRALPAGYDAASTPKATAGALALDLAVPKSVPSIVFSDENAVTRGQTTAFDKLAAIEHWFTTPSDGGFHYTLTPSPALPSGPAGITAFLKIKQGFCEQFATVFTLMARHLGLPARVAVGFTPGEPDPTTPGTYDVSTSDAHAWPEVWFSGIGWVRFEPTPRSGLGAFTPSYLATVAPPTKAAPSAAASAAPTVAPVKKPDPDALRPNPSAASATAGSSVSLAGVLTILGVVLLLLLALSPALGRLLVRRRRVATARTGAAPGAASAAVAAGSHALWSELMDTVRDVGVTLPVSDTPRAIGRRLAALLVPSRFGDKPDAEAFAGTPFAVGSVNRRVARGRSASGFASAGAADSVAGAGGVAVLEPPGETVELGMGGRSGSDEESGQERDGRVLAALGRVVSAEERARYGRPDAAGSIGGGDVGGHAGASVGSGGAGGDVRLIRSALLASAPGSVRVQAFLLPRSVLGRVRGRAAGGSRLVGQVTTALGVPARSMARKLRRH